MHRATHEPPRERARQRVGARRVAASRDKPRVRGDADRFRAIFDAANDGIFISDPATGEFTEINERCCSMFGYVKAELLGRDVNALSSGVHPHTRQAAIALNEKARLGEPQIFEWLCKTKDGVLFWTEISLRYTESDGAPAIVGIVRDIGERKRLDTRLKLALQDASAANKAKSAFLATMSHELRTPLNAIIGFSDLMLLKVLGPLGHPRYREYIDDIHRSGLQLLALIDDLLDLARIDAGKADLADEPVSLHRVVTHACRMLVLQAKEANVDIAVDVPAGLPDIRGDERRIKQIILNLLTNAIKFTPEGGRVSVRAERSSNEIMLEVTDTGIGIAEEDLPKVLEQFGQLDSALARQHKGSGLGLPLAKQLIELHGGSLKIVSKVGVGTNVRVSFPIERIIKTSRAI